MNFDHTHSYGWHRKAIVMDFERQYLEWLLDRHSGNLSAAAREARMDRKYLFELRKKHGIGRKA